MDPAALRWTRVAALQELSPNSARRFMLDGVPVCIYRTRSGVFATQDTCTHAEASLADGFMEDDTVECPLHQGIFHIPTGKAMSAPLTRDLKVYLVKVDAGNIYVADGEARR